MLKHNARRSVLILFGCMFLLMLAMACAKTPQTAAPAPAPAPVQPPTAAPAPSPTLTPTPAAPVTPSASVKDGQPLVPGAPPFYPSVIAKLAVYSTLEKYHMNKLKMWTKASYGGEQKASGTWTPTTALNFLTIPFQTRPLYAGTLFLSDYGLCSFADRENFDTCDGKLARINEVVLRPSVILKWEQPDPTTFIFTLRKGVMWPAVPPMNRADREVTAQDIVWFLDITKKEGALRDYIAVVDTMEATDKYTIRLKLKGPQAEFLRNLANGSLGIFPKECYDEKDCLGSKMVSPAPFLLKESIVRQKVVLDRNPEFHLKGLPYIDRYTQIFIADTGAVRAAFITGQLDLSTATTPSDAELVSKQVPGIQIHANTNNTGAAHLRPKLEGPLADIRVRRALAMTMDLPTLWDVAFEGFTMFPTLVSRDFFGAEFYMTLEQAGQWYQYNPAKAKQLMAEAGFANGFTVAVMASQASGGRYDQLLFLQSQWRKNLNVDLKITVTDQATTLVALADKRWTGFIERIAIDQSFWPSADLNISPFVKGTGTNYQDIDDPIITDLYAKERAELDPAKRAALLWQFEQRELDQIYALRLNMLTNITIKQPWEMNWTGHPTAYTSMAPISLMLDTAKIPKR